jgi:hypothetical protein
VSESREAQSPLTKLISGDWARGVPSSRRVPFLPRAPLWRLDRRGIALTLSIPLLLLSVSLADEVPPKVALVDPSGRSHHPIRRREATGRPSQAPVSGHWWLGTAGIGLVLGAFGALSLASRRWKGLVGREASGLQVIGRTALSPRHSVYLVRAGERVFLIGAGPQGPPAFLGELHEPTGPDSRQGDSA